MRSGLLYAGTEKGVYVSFDDGDHWQPLQANLPVTSVRDLDVHGDDLVIATHGRAFWVLDDVTPLRQLDAQGGGRRRLAVRAGGRGPAAAGGLHRHADAAGTRRRRPTRRPGAVIDYVLKAGAKQVTLEIRDERGDAGAALRQRRRGAEAGPRQARASRRSGWSRR